MTEQVHAELETERYYAAQWAKEGWNKAEPNRDEAARWAAMQPLVERALQGVAAPSILDLGCGRGWLTALLSHHGETLGVDPVAASVGAAQSLFPHLRFRCARSDQLLNESRPGQATASRFHLVVSSEVIEHVPDSDKPSFLADVRDLLIPGGHLLLTTPRGVFWEAWLRRAPRTQPVEEWVNERELDRLVCEAGFHIVERDRAHRLRRPLGWHGVVLQRVLVRRYVRRLPLFGLRRWLDYEARFYQVGLWRKSSTT